MRSVLFWMGLVGLSLTVCDRTLAQVTIDGTLKTDVSSVGNDFTITNGTAKGANLFHSFGQFSVPTGGSATFDLVNTPAVSTIFSRVTGGIPSSINGAIRTINSTNPVSLFLINPSGILFGANASLNIGGSFIGTTASSVKFADRTEFSAASANEPPLLTISAPIGLQMGQAPGTITNRAAGLSVQPGQMLALIGGDILFQGGVINAPDSAVELGSVGAGSFVSLIPNSVGWNFDYSEVQAFRTIEMTQAALIDTEGATGGTIHGIGSNLLLKDQSTIYTAAAHAPVGGNITLHLKDSIQLNDQSYIGNDVVDGQQGGAIQIQTPQLLLQNQSQIATTSWGTGHGGTLRVRSNLVQVQQASDLGSFAVGSGNGGTVLIQAQDISVSGVTVLPDGTNIWSAIAASTQGTGNAGKLQIETQRLVLQDGGVVGASTFATGNAGSIEIRASDTVQILGTGGSADLPSAVRAEVRLGATGNGGNISLTTNLLSVAGGGTISVSGNEVGNAGDILLNANQIRLMQGGSIQAKVNVGSQGNIAVNTGLLLLRNGSNIVTSAGDLANGGNINLNASVIVGLGNSDIVANAIQGQGGNIQITTQGILGLQFRDRLTPENDITASSQFGINGTVKIDNFGVNPNSGLVQLPSNIVDPSQKIAQGCRANQGSSFIVTGRGGIPANPLQKMTSYAATWNDLRDFVKVDRAPTEAVAIVTKPSKQNAPLIEATSWQQNPTTGNVELIAAQLTGSNAIATCAPAQ